MANTATIDSVRQLLAVANDGSLPQGRMTIDSSVLASVDPAGLVGALLACAFDGEAAVLTGARANPAGEGDKLVVNGTCSFRLGDPLSTQLTVWLDAQQQVQVLFAFCMIPAVAPANPWSFSKSFPDLPASFEYGRLGKEQVPALDQLDLANASFYAATCATRVGDTMLSAGLSFMAEVQASGVFGLFLNLVAPDTRFVLSGTVKLPPAGGATAPVIGTDQFPWDVPGGPYGINLALSVPLPKLEFGSALSVHLDGLRIYSPTSAAWLAKNTSYAPLVAWTGALDAPGAGVHVDVTAIAPPGTGEAEIVVGLANSGLPSLAGLAGLTGGADLLGALPKGWAAPVDMGLDSIALVLQAGKKGPAVLEARATVSMKQPWTIWDPYFVVESIRTTFAVATPFSSPQLEVRVDGMMQICGKPFAATAIKSEGYQVTLSLADKVNVPLSTLLADYFPGMNPPSDLTIDALSMTAAPGRYYSLMLGMASQPNPWIIDLGLTKLTFSDIELFAMRSSQAGMTGSVSGSAAVGALTLEARYDLPGDILIRADLPATDLRTLASTLADGLEILPSAFNLSFSESYVLLQKQGKDYRWQMGTLVSSFGSLAFVVQRGDSGWGFAAGLAISVADVNKLPAVGSTIGDFASWFPFDDFVLAVSSLKDSSFEFPDFKSFDQGALGNSKIKLPASVQGIDKGFYLYTNTRFSKKNKILGALIDLLGIPEGTQVQAMVSYLTQKQQFQLGISVTSFITPLADVSQRTCQGALGYRNGCMTGTIFVQVQGGSNFSLGLAGSLKTRIQDTDVDFTVILALVENGIFVSGTMDNKRPLELGPLKIGGLALELGISFEGIPSFGFAGELDVAGAFNSSLAVLVDSANPSNCMVAAALSDLTLGDIVDKLLGELSVPVAPPFLQLLSLLSISGTKHGRFTVSGQDATAFANALDNFDGEAISNTFVQYGKLPSFASSSEGLMLFVDTPGRQWYLTEKSGSGDNSLICHWQVSKNAQGQISVSKEAQLYFVPSPSGTRIGTFYYSQGMVVSGRLKYLFIDADVDIVLSLNKGIKVAAELDKIVLGTEKLFSVTSEDGATGPKLSLCSFDQPLEPKDFQKPHFYVSGKMQMLGISRSLFININESGATFSLKGDLVPALVKGSLKGEIGKDSLLDVNGNVFAGIPDIDLGSLGNWNIKSGVAAATRIWAGMSDLGASLSASFELGGQGFSLPEIKLNIATQSLADLPEIFFNAVKDFLVKLFTDPKAWAEMANKVLAWTTDQISSVLGSIFHLDADTIKAILAPLCPVATALSIL